MAARRTKVTVALVVVAAVAVAAVVAGRAVVHAFQSHFTSTGCTVGGYDLDTDQASVAAQMVGAATKFRPHLPDHASVLALMAGLQESKLTNIAPNAGDRDSVGVLQQRPSQGWGHHQAAVLTDVTEATREFLAALVKVPHWRTRPAADAIQAVQISADGSAYAQHESEATALARAFLGRRPAAINCSFDKPTLVASTAKVVAMLRHQLPVNAPRRARHRDPRTGRRLADRGLVRRERRPARNRLGRLRPQAVVTGRRLEIRRRAARRRGRDDGERLTGPTGSRSVPSAPAAAGP